MPTLVQWLQTYSLPVALLLIIGAGLLFLVKLVIERTVETQFRKLSKEIELRLERRSRFEERILLDRYLAAGELFGQIQRASTSVNRHIHGYEVEGLFRGKELVPVTEFYEMLDAKTYLLGDELVGILDGLAEAVLSLASAHTPEQQKEAAAGYARLRAEFHVQMSQTFGIDKIVWS
jgi:hypothetical protein